MPEPTASIQHEIGQERPFRSTAQAAAVSLLRTASLLHHRFEVVAQQEDITFQQYNVLRILRGADGPLPTMLIGERLVQQTPGVTRLLDRLEKKGLIQRIRSATDRRQVHCALTPAGHRMLDRLAAPFDRLDDASMGGLTEREQAELLRLLDAVRQALPAPDHLSGGP